MNLFWILDFTIFASLTLVTKAGWETLRCWKDDLGYCRKRCLRDERYKLLCENKQTCCIPRILSPARTPRPPYREIPIEEITTESYTEIYPEITKNDYFTFKLSNQDVTSEAKDNTLQRP